MGIDPSLIQHATASQNTKSSSSSSSSKERRKKRSVQFKKSKPKYAPSNTGSKRRVYDFCTTQTDVAASSPSQSQSQSQNNKPFFKFNNNGYNERRISNNLMMVTKQPSKKVLKDGLLNNLWIWKYLYCLELNSDYRMDEIFNSNEWTLLCKYKLSNTIRFLKFDMLNDILNPDNFNAISNYFPNLEYLDLYNWDYFEKYSIPILEFFKLRPYHCLLDTSISNDGSSSTFGSGWEKVESSLIKLKGIKFENTNENVLNLLCNNIILCNELNNKFIYESLFTQLILLNVNNCKIQNIAHLQIILNGCINQC